MILKLRLILLFKASNPYLVGLLDSFNRFVGSGERKMGIPLRSLVALILGVVLRGLSDGGMNWLSLLSNERVKYLAY